jgi:hypothetical protein
MPRKDGEPASSAGTSNRGERLVSFGGLYGILKFVKEALFIPD